MIPPLDGHGLLPPGVHDCTLGQLRERFAYSPHRRAILHGLCRFVRQELRPLNLPAPMYVDGSFVRSKPLPSDVDVVLDVQSYTLAEAMPVLALWFDRARLKETYRVDFWVKHPVLPNDLCAFFQYLGDKAAADLGLATKWPKGILRLAP